MKLNTLKKHIVKAGLLSLLSALTLTATALAQEEKRDYRGTGQVEASADTKIVVKSLSNLEAIAAPQALLSTAPGAATFGAALTVQVDHSYCRTGGIQCFLPGQAPSDVNRNPVRLGLQVLNGGAQFSTLTDADVDVLNSFVPAGGAAVSQITGVSTFQNAGNGMYAIFVAPGAGQTWKPGSYFVQVRVNVNGVIQRALAQIEITF
jgi:hypothetical protein